MNSKSNIDELISTNIETDRAEMNSDLNAENINTSLPDGLRTPEPLVQAGYLYVQQIGEGANGRTYRARNLKTSECVAIKALKFSDNLKNYELFKREAEVLQTLNVKGVPKYYDYIAPNDEFTECWIVQEYVIGDSLLEHMSREPSGRLGEIETLHIVREIAKILYCLQTQYVPPIIHRDIKPSNILLRYVGNNNTPIVHLIDFGAVANPQKRSGGSTVAGTVGYMAPEQLIGDSAIQSDYYSLGATALHLLTGIIPSEFESDGFVLNFEHTLREKVPDIQEETIALLKKLLAVHVQDRPKGPDELIHCIDDTILSLMKKGMRNPAKLMNQNSSMITILSKLSNIYPKVRMGLVYLIVIVSIGLFLYSIFKNILAALGFILCIALVVIIETCTPENILKSLSTSKRQYLNKYNALMYLSSIVERDQVVHSEQPQLNIMRGKKRTVQGKVTAVYPGRTEVTFELNGKTYACSEYHNNIYLQHSHNIGDILYVHYTKSLFGKIKTHFN